MIDPKLFEKLEAIARLIRKSPKVFGGIQIVATGDFFQLPPVSNNGDAQFVYVPSSTSVHSQQIRVPQVGRDDPAEVQSVAGVPAEGLVVCYDA